MNVIWSSTAEMTYEAEKEYILKKWTINEVIKFIDIVDDSINRLKYFPTIGRLSKKNDRFLVISKQTTLVYRLEKNDTIQLLLFWNNQWNPNDMEKLL